MLYLFHYSFAKERTTLAIQHSHIRRTIGCLIWELRKCCIFASPKAGFFWTIVFVIQTPSNSDGTCWRVSIPSFYDAHVETSTLSMSFKHILHGKLVMFSASLTMWMFLKGMSLSPPRLYRETGGGQHPNTTRNDWFTLKGCSEIHICHK